MKADFTSTHRRTARVQLETWEVVKAIQEYARRAFLEDLPEDCIFEVKLRQATEGSPSYTIDKWYATVTITQNISTAEEPVWPQNPNA